MPMETAKKAWNDRMKCTISYPSVRDGGSGATQVILAIADAVEISGIGYNHTLRGGLSVWNQVMVTTRNEGQSGRIAISQAEPAYAMIMWLAMHDQFFDIYLDEIPSEQNAGQGQLVYGQRALFGCKANPMDERWDGDLPMLAVPFSWLNYGYVTATGYELIGDGKFTPPGTVPTEATEQGT